MEDVIKVVGLNKYYSGKQVLNNINFSLKRGESLGILGSNGAGKSTLLETVEGLRNIDEGSVTVLGKDIASDYKAIQKSIGVQLQKSSLFGELSVHKNVILYAGLYDESKNVDTLLQQFDLTEIKDTIVDNLSGGQFQRLNLCIAMLNNPVILFLDEPTTGLDPKARRNLWDKVKAFKNKGCSVIITTHYMDEAQELCDRVIILRKGSILADDSPQNLMRNIAHPKIIELEVEGNYLEEIFAAFDYKKMDNKLHFRSLNLTQDLVRLIKVVETAGLNMIDIGFRQAKLEDVYMELTNTEQLQEAEPSY